MSDNDRDVRPILTDFDQTNGHLDEFPDTTVHNVDEDTVHGDEDDEARIVPHPGSNGVPFIAPLLRDDSRN